MQKTNNLSIINDLATAATTTTALWYSTGASTIYDNAVTVFSATTEWIHYFIPFIPFGLNRQYMCSTEAYWLLPFLISRHRAPFSFPLSLLSPVLSAPTDEIIIFKLLKAQPRKAIVLMFKSGATEHCCDRTMIADLYLYVHNKLKTIKKYTRIC